MHHKQMKKRFLLVMLAFTISALSVLLVPFAVGEDGNLNTLGYIAGGMFWAGLLLGIVGYILLCKKADIPDRGEKKIPGIFRFFSNPPAKVIDVIFIAGIIGTAYYMRDVNMNQIVEEIFLLCLIAGGYAHILLNGKIYRYIWKNAKKRNVLCENKGGM